jgi:flagellar basal body-associated protein FliL
VKASRGGFELEKKGNFFVLLVIIAVLTLIVAVLSAFIIIVGINPPVNSVTAESNLSSGVRGPELQPVDDNLISTLKLFEKEVFRVHCDEGKLAVVRADVTIKYINKLDGIKDVSAKVSLHEDSLREITGKYFQRMECTNMSLLETRLQAKEDLKDEMNAFLLATIEKDSDRRKVTEIIYEVVFPTWNEQHS